MEITGQSYLTRDPVAVPVIESSQAGEARRNGVSIAHALGFDEQQTGEVAIAITEAAMNLVRHAKGGEIILQSTTTPSGAFLEMLSIDRGPGMSSFSDSLRDGHSTGNTPGTGLGAIVRLSSTFDVFTAPSGTVLYARFGKSAAALNPPALSRGAVCLPKKGEEACGDAYAVHERPDGHTLVLVADGLGHGLQAAEASRAAVRVFHDNVHLDTPRIAAAVHAGLRGTRGAAIAVAEIRHSQNEIRFTGVGNIAAVTIVDGKSRAMLSHNGTAGMEARRVQEFTYPWRDENLLVMHSDGISSQWGMGAYPGVRFKHPAVLAGLLYRDFRRERDDATVLVIGGAQSGGEQ